MDCLKTAIHSRNMWQEYWSKKVYAYVHGTCVLYALCIEWLQFWMEHMNQWLIGRKWWIQAECQHSSWCSVFRSAAGSPARCARCTSNSVSLKLEVVLWITPGNTDCVPQRGTTSYSCKMNEVNVWIDRPRKRRTDLHPSRLMMPGWLIPCCDGGGCGGFVV